MALTLNNKTYLHEIGLSAHAVTLYELLLNKGPLTAQAVASETFWFPSAVYRLFYELSDKSLVIRKSGRPVVYEALALPTGLQASYAVTQKTLQSLLTQQPPGDEHLELLVGREALYDRYNVLAAQSKTEIRVYSIGIAYSKTLYSVQKSAIKRGVSVRLVVQQAKPSNYHIIHKWQHLGVQVRHLQTPRGFHVMVFDRKIVVISFSDPINTDNRLSIVTNNTTAVNIFLTYFQDIWTSAQEINTL